MPYCECGNELDKDCNGNERCDVCDPPCPCCSDGPGPSIFDEDDVGEEDSIDGMEWQEMMAE